MFTPENECTTETRGFLYIPCVFKLSPSHVKGENIYLVLVALLFVLLFCESIYLFTRALCKECFFKERKFKLNCKKLLGKSVQIVK